MLRKAPEDFTINLKEKRQINSIFAISERILAITKNGDEYIKFTLCDKKGTIPSKIFLNGRDKDLYNSIKKGSICNVRGNVDEYPPGSGVYSITINNIINLPEDEFDRNDLVRVSPRNDKELIHEIESTIKLMEDHNLKKLLNAFFEDKKFTDEFYKSPSAKLYHHNYIKGLLEHTVGVLNICKSVCGVFPELDKDLLYTGAILHDIGKLKVYDYDEFSIVFSDEGELLEHIFISCDMIQEKVKELDLPQELSTKLLHLVLSHHGEVKNGWGSSVNPKIPEAVALHHADNLDAQVKNRLQSNSS